MLKHLLTDIIKYPIKCLFIYCNIYSYDLVWNLYGGRMSIGQKCDVAKIHKTYLYYGHKWLINNILKTFCWKHLKHIFWHFSVNILYFKMNIMLLLLCYWRIYLMGTQTFEDLYVNIFLVNNITSNVLCIILCVRTADTILVKYLCVIHQNFFFFFTRRVRDLPKCLQVCIYYLT